VQDLRQILCEGRLIDQSDCASHLPSLCLGRQDDALRS
jgi:hypothetical protein